MALDAVGPCPCPGSRQHLPQMTWNGGRRVLHGRTKLPPRHRVGRAINMESKVNHQLGVQDTQSANSEHLDSLYPSRNQLVSQPGHLVILSLSTYIRRGREHLKSTTQHIAYTKPEHTVHKQYNLPANRIRVFAAVFRGEGVKLEPNQS